MVVLLAIAGGVAAVLFSRGQTATQQLEATDTVSAPAKDYTSRTLCDSVSGLKWSTSENPDQCVYDTSAGCTTAGGVVTAAAPTAGVPTGYTAKAVSCATAATGGEFLGNIG